MGRFVEVADRQQASFLPACLEDNVEADNPVRIINAFADELDLAELGFARVQPASTGRPGYAPGTMLKLYVYGYLHQLTSSRKLERQGDRVLRLPDTKRILKRLRSQPSCYPARRSRSCAPFRRYDGADGDKLIRWTPRRINRHLMVLNGTMLETKVNPRSVIRICPRCAMDSIAAWPGTALDQVVIGRAEWTAAVVDVCLDHGVALISLRGPQLDVPRLDPGYQTSLLLDELHSIQPVYTKIDDFQLYVLSRPGIIAAKESALLDKISLEAVTQICHSAGHDLMRQRRHVGVIAGKDRRAAGFDLLGHGAAQFEQLLIEPREGVRVRQRARSVLPRLPEHLAKYRLRDTQCCELIEKVFYILFRILTYAEGEMLLGRICPGRQSPF